MEHPASPSLHRASQEKESQRASQGRTGNSKSIQHRYERRKAREQLRQIKNYDPLLSGDWEDLFT